MAILWASAPASSSLYCQAMNGLHKVPFNVQGLNNSILSGFPNLQSKLKGVTDRSGKKQRLQGYAAEGVAFDELHSGGSRTEAARLFFELLVLQSRKKVGPVSPQHSNFSARLDLRPLCATVYIRDQQSVKDSQRHPYTKLMSDSASLACDPERWGTSILPMLKSSHLGVCSPCD